MVAVNAQTGTQAAGLFLLQLRTQAAMPGAPTLALTLSVYTPGQKVTGHAIVTQALADPVVCQSSVSGPLIYETVMPPGKSAIRIDLTGYPGIQWPAGAGVGPVMEPNFRAMIVMATDYSSGVAHYQYLDASGNWHAIEQPISQA